MLYALLIGIIIGLLALYIREFKLVSAVAAKHIKLQADYEALDQGMAEVTDAYASDQAQWEETKEKLEELIVGYREFMIPEKDALLERLSEINANNQATNAELNQKLQIAQRVIDEHDKNCLPHLTQMMQEAHPLDSDPLYIKDPRK